ncbi:N-acyl-D-amino-acid deacylase (EC [Olavius sp. associated proteobacterium Delta 1]|nr:N-acyl-D-amino-acid deacylase (EC [Olavius sp. associated proteobacterium Delta 1]
MYELVIKNGKIIDGSGNPWRAADVAVADGRIARIDQIGDAHTDRIIDASGKFVCPGFVDGHSHSDLLILDNPLAEQKIMQGITTENMGLDGMSVTPIQRKDIPGWQRHLAGLAGNPDVDWSWESFADYLDTIDRRKVATNVCSYVGLGTIRLMVMGMDDRPANAEEIKQMQRIAAEAMEQGARGISAGLIYPPSLYQNLDEIVEIAKVVRRYDGIFDVHMRRESDGIVGAIEEVLTIGKQSQIPVLITHFKIRGKNNWGRAAELLQILQDAREQGLDVTVAQYPYTAGSTILHAVIPPWYHTQGPDHLIAMLRDDREPIKHDIRERMDWENFSAVVGWDKIFVTSVESEANKTLEGKHIAEIAAIRGNADPVDAAMDLLVEEKLAVGMVNFGLSEEDVVEIMSSPTVSFITDGLLGGNMPHPRTYGTCPRILGRYVRDQQVMSWEEAVRKMTSLPARKLRLKNKGMIAERYDADIVVFDPATVIDTATYETPRNFPDGIDWVIVNGKVVVKDGKHTGARNGKTIRD